MLAIKVLSKGDQGSVRLLADPAAVVDEQCLPFADQRSWHDSTRRTLRLDGLLIKLQDCPVEICGAMVSKYATAAMTRHWHARYSKDAPWVMSSGGGSCGSDVFTRPRCRGGVDSAAGAAGWARSG